MSAKVVGAWDVDPVHSYGWRRRGRARLDGKSLPQQGISSTFVPIFFDYIVVSCLFNSMSWVSSSTTACATTLVASAARGWGGRTAGGRIIDVLESPEHAPRNICLRRHVVKIEIVKCLKYWVVKRHCRPAQVVQIYIAISATEASGHVERRQHAAQVHAGRTGGTVRRPPHGRPSLR